VQQRKRAAHDALQEARATRGIRALRRNQLQQCERTIAERSDRKVER
jgi:hypothetical protein